MSEREIPNNEADILRIALDIANDRDVLKQALGRAHMEIDVLKEQYRISQAAASVALQACDEANERANAADGDMNRLLIDRANIIDGQVAKIRQLESNIDSLNCLVEHARLEVMEERRQKGASTVEIARLGGLITGAVAELRKIADNDPINCTALRAIADRLDGKPPRALSVPRHRTPDNFVGEPGTEVTT